MDIRTLYLATVDGFVGQVAAIPADGWTRPGLGVWDVRALVGHTARAITTVLDYAARPVGEVDVPTAADYLAVAIGKADAALHTAVAERGVAAGAELGDDPAGTVRGYRAGVAELLADPDDPVITTIAGGMRLDTYLQTRVFELTVHGLDLADALGTRLDLPAEAVELAAVTLALTGVRLGRAAPMIRLLTGRGGSTFSVF
jgi:uncharacterized protein (TIGR03083 family)